MVERHPVKVRVLGSSPRECAKLDVDCMFRQVDTKICNEGSGNRKLITLNDAMTGGRIV